MTDTKGRFASPVEHYPRYLGVTDEEAVIIERALRQRLSRLRSRAVTGEVAQRPLRAQQAQDTEALIDRLFPPLRETVRGGVARPGRRPSLPARGRGSKHAGPSSERPQLKGSLPRDDAGEGRVAPPQVTGDAPQEDQ